MNVHKKMLALLLALCLMLSLGITAFAASYSGDGVYRGLSGIQPNDNLTLPDNTAWATLTASWGVRVNFVDWDETVLKTELVPVTDTTPGISSAPADPTRDGYIFTGWERYDKNDGPATLNDEGTVTGINGPGPIVFIATYIHAVPELAVTKKSSLEPGESASLGQTITYTVTVENKGNVTISNIKVEDELAGAELAPGESDTIASLAPDESAEVHYTYVVTEADILTGSIWNAATAEGTDPNGDPVSDDGDCEDITDPAVGEIEVSKKSNLASGEKWKLNQTITYTITINNTGNLTISNIKVEDQLPGAKLASGETDTIASLAPGKSVDVHYTYVVTEADVLAGSIENLAVAEGMDPEGNPVSDGGDCEDPTEPAIGNLTVSKTVAGNGADSTKAFDFTVTLNDASVNGTYGDMTFTNGVAVFTLKDGESMTATDLPAGVRYKVTEADYSAEGYETSKSGDEGTIVYHQTTEASFTNTRMVYGNLTISKFVTGDLGDKTMYFTFKVEFDVGGTFSYDGSRSGTIESGGSIQLKHGESITIYDIPAGAYYSVTESGNSGYSVSASGDTGIIAEEKTSAAKFTNSKSSIPKTGEDNSMMLDLSLMAVSALGMAGTLLSGNNKRRKPGHVKNR